MYAIASDQSVQIAPIGEAHRCRNRFSPSTRQRHLQQRSPGKKRRLLLAQLRCPFSKARHTWSKFSHIAHDKQQMSTYPPLPPRQHPPSLCLCPFLGRRAGKVMAWPGPVSPYISNVLVHPQARRQGLGKRLMQRCEQQARDWGYTQVRGSFRPLMSACDKNKYRKVFLPCCVTRFTTRCTE